MRRKLAAERCGFVSYESLLLFLSIDDGGISLIHRKSPVFILQSRMDTEMDAFDLTGHGIQRSAGFRRFSRVLKNCA
ncbi:MAG TPA: hypothetical protein PKV75_03105 [Desulfobacterales bacterium]|nr:hypothetical protein [Desulfobacterales bacterium]